MKVRIRYTLICSRVRCERNYRSWFAMCSLQIIGQDRSRFVCAFCCSIHIGSCTDDFGCWLPSSRHLQAVQIEPLKKFRVFPCADQIRNPWYLPPQLWYSGQMGKEREGHLTGVSSKESKKCPEDFSSNLGPKSQIWNILGC